MKQIGPKAPAMPMSNPMEDMMQPNEEMLNLTVPSDRGYQVFWPIHQSFSMDTSGFRVLYPAYIDSNKTIQSGRRVGKEKAVDRPTVSDMSLALQSLQVRHVLQPYKGYSREPDTWDNPGRVLVDVSNHSKKDLMMHMCEKIPTLPDRIARLEREAEERKEKEENWRLEQEKSKKTITSTSTTLTNNKKKGKKGRKK